MKNRKRNTTKKRQFKYEPSIVLVYLQIANTIVLFLMNLKNTF